MVNYTVFDVANWFLSKESMNHKKLQKLCYYAQAWSYALSGEALFEGKFEAWVHGPVNRKLWDELKVYGYISILSTHFSEKSNQINTANSDFLERVWVTYGGLTGDQLEALSHTEKPWLEARNGIPEMQICTDHIDERIMQEYYSSKYSGNGRGE